LSIIFLDRNAIISIKKKIERKNFPPERRKQLRHIDKSINLITPLLSIYEGNLTKKQNSEELKRTILEETKLISKFFKNAKTDSEFLVDNITYLQDAFSTDWELKWNDYIKFLKFASEFLFQPIASNKKIDYEKKILDKAKELDIPIGHITVISCLSILYGSKITRGVLKFKQTMDEKDLYNILSDLMIPVRLLSIESIIIKQQRKDKIEYFTFDKSLKKLIKKIQLNFKKSLHTNNSVNIDIGITYDITLFPNLDEESFQEFKKRLKNS